MAPDEDVRVLGDTERRFEDGTVLRVRVLAVPDSEKFPEGVKYRLHYGTDGGKTVNYPTLLALTRSLRVGLPGSATRFFTDGRLALTVRAGSAVSAGVDLERPTPTRW